MSEHLSKPCTAFEGHGLLLSGSLVEVALAVKAALERGALDPLLVFDDATGRVMDLDLRGSKAAIISRLTQRPPDKTEPLVSGQVARADPAASDAAVLEPRGRGRPKLGVIAREVTLLPRQWDWLAAQPGGASAVLRRLVDDARRDVGAVQQRRAAQEAAYHFMSAMAGDLPGFEEASRALFADDRPRLEQHMSNWPEGIRAYVSRLFHGQGS